MGDFISILPRDITGTYSASPVTQAAPFQFSQYLTPTLLDDATVELCSMNLPITKSGTWDFKKPLVLILPEGISLVSPIPALTLLDKRS